MRMRDGLAAIDRLPFGSLDDLLGRGAAVVLAPHPDDETLGCGALIAAARAAGRDVALVVVTDGAASHPHSHRYPPTRLAALRRDELRCAAAALGVAPGAVTFLDLPDAAAPVCGPAYESAIERIDTVVRESSATALFVTWHLDPHCDHVAAAHMAEVVVDRHPGLRGWAYPIWGLHRPPEDDIGIDAFEGFRFDATPFLDVKRAALACHRSQTTGLIDDDPSGFRLSDADLGPFLGPTERFLAFAR